MIMIKLNKFKAYDNMMKYLKYTVTTSFHNIIAPYQWCQIGKIKTKLTYDRLEGKLKFY